MVTTGPLITIGITCFNAEATIARALESAGSQDWLNLEIIVVDDASQDNSVSIIKQAQRQDERIHFYCHSDNMGYPSALNTIIKHAKGEYIAFFDDDDDNEINRLKMQYERLASFEKGHYDIPVLCYSHRRVVVEGQEKPESFVSAIGYKAPEPYGSMVIDFLLWHKKARGFTWGEFGSCTMMASKKVLKHYGFDPKFRRSAEWDLAIRVAYQGGYFIAVDQPLVIQHKTPTFDKAGRKPLDYALMLRKKHKAYLQKNKVYWGAIFQAYSRFYYFRGELWKSRACLALACLLAPNKILIDEVNRRIKKRL